MIKLSKKVEYALISLLHMDGGRGHDLATAKEIADLYRMPPELLGKVMQSLARAGIVESIQGAHGGYRLLRPMDRLSVGDVIEALEGPIYLTPCCSGEQECRQEAACNIKRPVQRIQEVLQHFIYGISLATFRPGAGDSVLIETDGLHGTGKGA